MYILQQFDYSQNLYNHWGFKYKLFLKDIEKCFMNPICNKNDWPTNKVHIQKAKNLPQHLFNDQIKNYQFNQAIKQIDLNRLFRWP